MEITPNRRLVVPTKYFVYNFNSDIFYLHHRTPSKKVTNDLVRRVSEHRQELIPGFTKTYHIHTLVYFEQGTDIGSVILREKQLKTWNRKWKLAWIEKENPEWNDLWNEIF